MIWHEWVEIVVLILLLMACIIYLFICGMESLFPHIFNKRIDTISDTLSHCKGKHSKYKPRNRRMLFHNIGSYSQQCNESCDNYQQKNKPKITFTHFTSKIKRLVGHILNRWSTKCKQNPILTLLQYFRFWPRRTAQFETS